jgi:phosphoglucosamine mutase
MRKEGCNVGGEQSGHLILKDYSLAGDGMLASLQMLKIMRLRDVKASALQNTFETVPQQLVNINKGADSLKNPAVISAIQDGENSLKGIGRVFIRPSGTEPLIRVMVESDESDSLKLVMNKILKAIESA